nr:hypothetical protein [Arthrobacter alpinus]
MSMEMTWLPVGGRTTAHGLRQDNTQHQLAAVHAQGAGGVVLALVYRADAAADDLSHVGGLVQSQAQQGRTEREIRTLAEPMTTEGPPNGKPNAITGYRAATLYQKINWTNRGVPRKNQM